MGAERIERTHIRHFMSGDQITPADLDAIQSQFVGDGIEQTLAHERGLESTGCAVGSARCLIGQPDMHRGPIGWNAIWTR